MARVYNKKVRQQVQFERVAEIYGLGKRALKLISL